MENEFIKNVGLAVVLLGFIGLIPIIIITFWGPRPKLHNYPSNLNGSIRELFDSSVEE
jgi:hypothetical protein